MYSSFLMEEFKQLRVRRVNLLLLEMLLDLNKLYFGNLSRIVPFANQD